MGNLIQKSDLLSQIMEKIRNDDGKNEDKKNIMSIMAQEFHFNPLSEGIGIADLRDVFDYTDETIRMKLKNLFDRGLVEKIKSRPVKYRISNDYLEN